jgi:two-component sensor histidine kinase
VINQRELLLKEIHHRVKNNLQVISALLEMQAARTTDENVKAAIKEGQNRVLSIAFIHQNLYQHDDLKGVEINSFLRELTSHIRQVFERPGCPVEVVNEVPKFYLDIDSAIPLGLLINELLTNAYKYAFAGKNSGMIRIKIEDLGEGSYSFCFIDDGVGLPNDFDFTRSNTLGMKLIRQLSRQLAGNIYYKYDGGCKFELTFKNLNARSKML